MSDIIIAIDGPSGAGKSTVARLLARRTGYTYIDTGAMYRAVALKAEREHIDINDGAALVRLCDDANISFRRDEDNILTMLNGEDISDAIRTPEMSLAASAISAKREVRDALLKLQRKMGDCGGVVLEGRDVGTVIFPHAECKFFLDAALEERASRRYRELRSKGMDVSLERTLEEVRQRDLNDSSRDIAPLKRAEDAILIDSTCMTIEEVVDMMNTMAQRRASEKNSA